MSFRAQPNRPGVTLARLLLASVFIVMGAWRLWGVLQGAPASGATLSFGVAELVLGLLVAAGWRLRLTALLSAALLLADAALSHPFWSLPEPGRSAQLLHFMKNIAIVGGFVLLATVAPAARRR